MFHIQHFHMLLSYLKVRSHRQKGSAVGWVTLNNEGRRDESLLTHRMELSSDPETMVLPSEVKATHLTCSECPSSTNLTSPVDASHTLVRQLIYANIINQ